MQNTLYLVLPCYNEEEVLPETSRQLDIKMGEMIEHKLISKNSKVLFVDDGSKDKTWEIIKQLHNKNDLFFGLKLAHNSGEQNAYIAGMMAVKEHADMVITMDADLQDDIAAIDKMVLEYYAGNEIVYGVRSSRKKDSFIKRFPAKVFYKLMGMLGTELISNHSQYRLMSQRAIEALSCYSEVNLFLPALIPLIGYKSSIVYYERHERFAGKTKYSFWKLVAVLVEGVTSFSFKPIQIINILALISFCAVVMGVIVMITQKIQIGEVSSWLMVFTSIWAVGAFQLLALRIIGYYIGKTYLETKKRPRYIVSESLIDDD